MEEEEINEKFVINNNIKVFKDIGENLQGCMKVGEEKFKCKDCDLFSDCFRTLNDSVAAISLWLANFIEESQLHKKKLTSFVLELKEKTSEDDFYI